MQKPTGVSPFSLTLCFLSINPAKGHFLVEAMLYFLQVNSALLKLGVNPNDVDPTVRKIGQAFGRAEGYSPEATALLIASEATLVASVGRAATIRHWIRAQKLDPTDHMVAAALSIVGTIGAAPDEHRSCDASMMRSQAN